jgi:two-component system sensor kinase FixL
MMLTGRTKAIASEFAPPAHSEPDVIEIADRERRRLGRELHDGLCQSLAGIAALTAALSRDLAANVGPGPAASASEILRLLNEAISEARDLARGLTPVAVRGRSLVDALGALARNVSRAHGTHCVLIDDGRCPSLRGETTTHLVRIAQEAVRNAISHGKADEIEIRLDCRCSMAVLSICDRGVGLPEDFRDRAGLGLHTMDYRADAIGGALKVAPHPVRGVVVTCAFPLPAPAGHRGADAHMPT